LHSFFFFDSQTVCFCTPPFLVTFARGTCPAGLNPPSFPFSPLAERRWLRFRNPASSAVERAVLFPPRNQRIFFPPSSSGKRRMLPLPPSPPFPPATSSSSRIRSLPPITDATETHQESASFSSHPSSCSKGGRRDFLPPSFLCGIQLFQVPHRFFFFFLPPLSLIERLENSDDFRPHFPTLCPAEICEAFSLFLLFRKVSQSIEEGYRPAHFPFLLFFPLFSESGFIEAPSGPLPPSDTAGISEPQVYQCIRALSFFFFPFSPFSQVM